MCDRKAQQLAEIYGYDDYIDMVEEYHIDNVVPGICINYDCDYCTDVEPDSRGGYCESCDTNTVTSILILTGIC